MTDIIVSSFFTSGGTPVSGLTPTIRIWEVNSDGHTLLIGSTEGTQDPGPIGGGTLDGAGAGTDGIMSEVHEGDVADADAGIVGGSVDGFYKYIFDSAHGYDSTKSYVFRVDGGVGQSNSERYQAGKLDPTDNIDSIVDAVWDEAKLDHQVAGSFGAAVNQQAADLSLLALNLTDVESLVGLLVKFETGRTRIDHVAGTMTIYDDDCTTPLRTFSLLDSSGSPSTTEICERLPQADGTSDGLPVCQ